MSALASYLYEQLKQRGWSQNDLATCSGIPKATISRLLNDQVDEPELATFVRLADTLGVSLGDLLELAGYPVGAPASAEVQRTRLDLLAESFPWLTPMAESIVELTPEDRESVIVFLEALQRRRQKS